MSGSETPQHIAWAVDCWVESFGPEEAENKLKQRFPDDHPDATEALAYLRREYDRGVTA